MLHLHTIKIYLSFEFEYAKIVSIRKSPQLREVR